jgi:hypothetical protein
MDVRRMPMIAVLLAAVLLFAAACQGDETEPEATATSPTVSPETTGASPSASPAVELVPVPDDVKASDFDPGFFDENSANITNPWWPVEPGTRWVWKGHATEDGERVERKVMFVATDLTKVIAGVRTRVGWDNDYNDGFLGETEIIFLAQDTAGNVWHLGQHREVYEDEFVGSRLWVVGDPEGAEAGILMKADPTSTTGSYSQGFAPPPWDWDDRARLYDTGLEDCVPVDCYEDVVVIEEFEPSVPGASQLKYYAQGVGNIRVGWAGKAEEEREVMVLVKFEQLDAEALAAAREKALAIEDRAYAYARTQPAEIDA